MNKILAGKTKIRILLILTLILAFALRFYAVDKVPTGLNADEAAIGYNAYSLIQTGKDEYGEILPLSFKSFGDYKPGLYFYFVIPFVAVLGLNELAVRLPSVLLGTLMIPLIYLIAKLIFKDRKIAFFSALFLAINPWAIHFSRGGWETNAAAFFITLGVYLFIKGLEKYHYLFFSLLSFLVAVYLYQATRLVAPLLVFALAVLFWKELYKTAKNHYKKLTLGAIILIVLSIPIILQFLSGGGSQRFQGLSFLSDGGPLLRVNELRGEHNNSDSLAAKLMHNKAVVYSISFLGHYIDHFSGNFLFINGDPLIRNKTPEVGQFFLIQSLFLFAGLIFLIKVDSKFKYLLVVWILISPAASSLTYQTPHAVRALSMVVPLTIIMSFGFVSLLRLIKKRPTKFAVGILLILILGFEFGRYLESYYIHSPKRYPLAWQHGFSEMVQKLGKYENNVSKVVITDKYDQPYILVLFYKQYNPAKYQPQAMLSERDKFNFGTVRSFDKYEFHAINKDEIQNSPDTLFIAAPEEVGENANIIDTVYFPNGEKAFVFVQS